MQNKICMHKTSEIFNQHSRVTKSDLQDLNVWFTRFKKHEFINSVLNWSLLPQSENLICGGKMNCPHA